MDNNITGSAGEFLVAAELSRRGCIATLTLKNTPLIDVLVSSPERGRVANIQVKTRSASNNQGWPLNKKVEDRSNIKNLFYVFVNLGPLGELPEYYIIPFNKFASHQQKKHAKYLKGKKKDGSPRKDTNIRTFKPHLEDQGFGERYRNNWDILGIF